MKKRIVLLGMALCMVLASPVPASAKKTSTEISASIKDKESQVSAAEKEKDKLQGSLTDLKKIVDGLELKKQDLAVYVKELDGALTEIEEKIAQLKQQIAEKEEQLIQTQAELDEALAREENQKESMIRRIRLMYEKGDYYLMDMLLDADGFGDFLNKADYVESIMAYDHEKWEEYIENRKLVELCKTELELEKENLDLAKANVEQEESNLQTLIAQKNQDITSYETDISNKEKAIREYEEMIARQDAEIKALEAAIAEERRQLLENNGQVIIYDGGMFKFPLASYTRISDDYGMRMHPTLGVEKFHNGVDFAAKAGTPIYAAYDGKVVAAAYSSTMGNYVMIDHGSELYTIYMHASALYVERGDLVVKGDTIAGVGTTGRSTGNHLHFGVRRNGEYVSPWEYLSQ